MSAAPDAAPVRGYRDGPGADVDGPPTGPRPSARRAAIRLGGLGLAAAVCAVVASPLYLTGRSFATDWTNSLWAINAAPPLGSLFLHNRALGVYYPLYGFYGGPLYESAKWVSVAVGGQPVAVYLAIWLGCIAVAYWSVYAIARRMGVARLSAHLPAIAFLTAPYYLTNLYGRGDFSEFVATSAIPLVAVAVVAALADERRPPWALPTLVAGVWLATGSHLLTAVLGMAFLGVLGVGAIAVKASSGQRWLRPGRALPVVAATGLGLGLNAWYLVPALVLGPTTVVGHSTVRAADFAWLTRPGIVFSPVPRVAVGSTSPGLYLQLPVGFLLLALGVLAWAILERPRRLRWAATAALLCLLAALLVLTMTSWAWRWLPTGVNVVQFPYRLLTYVDCTIVALVIVALRWSSADAPGRRRGVATLFAVIAVVATGTAVVDAWRTPVREYTRQVGLTGAATLPPTWYDHGVYRNATLPVVRTDPGRRIDIPPGSVRHDRFAAVVDVPPGVDPIVTNISGDPRLVKIEGVAVVGRTTSGFLVVRRERDGTGPLRLQLMPQPHGVAAAGKWITFVTVVLLFLGLLAGGVRLIRRRARRHDAPIHLAR